MAAAISAEKIDVLVKNLDRPQLLALLGVEDMPGQVGDNEYLRPVASSTVERFLIHKDDAPFLQKIDNGCCSGAIVRRYGKASIGVPCFSQEIGADGKFCSVCNEIWSERDGNGCYILDTKAMPFAAKFYKPAKSAVLWNLPFMRNMKDFFSEQVQVVKDVLDGTEAELERDWPYKSFKEVSSDILMEAGVLHRDAARSKNPYKRDQWEHDRLAGYLQNMIQGWLQISAVLDTEDMAEDMKRLQKAAKKVGLASMWAVQHENPTVQIWAGPLVPADIMLAGFRSGAKAYRTMVHNLSATSGGESVVGDEFSWGADIKAMEDWAHTVLMAKRPPRKAKKDAPQSPQKSGTPVQPNSPSQVRRWYAAKGTARPGAYVYKDVADSYNIDGKGSIKMFRSLAKLRKWMHMAAPRMFFESECNPAPLPDAQEQSQDEVSDETPEDYFAIKGGDEAGVFSDMSEAIQAKERGGGTFAVFTSKREAEEYIRAETAFVVWVGRRVGIMSKAQCVQATQMLPGAMMCGPISQAQAAKKWKKVKAKSRVVTDKPASAPATPKKPNVKKKQPTPKKKKFFYAVAKGKVPGVYDSWSEAEKQVRGQKKNRYAKFASKSKAQEYVDKHQPASGSESEAGDGESEDEEEKDDDDQGKAPLDIEIPSVEKLQEAEDKGQVRVFACHTDIGTARVAVTFDDAIRGVKNPSVQVINAKSTLLDNLAEAEIRLRNDKTNVRKSMQDRLAEARARAGAASHAKKTAPAHKSSRAEGEKLGAFVGTSAIGRAKETRMITFHFLNDEFTPIVTSFDQMPFMHELDEDMDLPDTKAQFNPAAAIKDLTVKDFFNAKEKALPTWKLMGFQELMSFCRKAQRMCQRSSRKVAAANAAALGELMDVGLRTYRTMDRLGELGPDDIRFKARMYLHLQYMCEHRVFHASAMAMTVFADATDPFVARIPGHSVAKKQRQYPSGAEKSRFAGGTRKPAVRTPPVSGCYKCPASDHYANDTRYHPVPLDGTKEKLSDETKAAILKRVDGKASLSEAAKEAEKEKVRQYWSQHEL